MQDEDDSVELDGPGPLLVELLYDVAPRLDTAHLRQRIRQRVPDGDVEETGELGLMISFPAEEAPGFDRPLPYMVSFLPSAQRFDPAAVRTMLEQSWNWQDAGKAVADGQRTALMTDPLGSLQDQRHRVRLFREALAAVVETTHPLALLFRGAQQVVEPGDLVDSVQEGQAPLFGLVNVRLFRVGDGREGEIVMDTLGMAPLGLPDLQCHFVDLDPQAVAGLLHSLANYLLGHGDVIEDGHTIEGTQPGSRWRCVHEESLVAPDRIVLDVDPEAPHSAR